MKPCSQRAAGTRQAVLILWAVLVSTPISGAWSDDLDQDGAANGAEKRLKITVELAADVWPGKLGSSPHIPVVWREAMYFSAKHPNASRRIWRYDGDSIEPAFDMTSPQEEEWPELSSLDDRLIYTVTPPARNDGNPRKELWEFDGTTQRRVPDASCDRQFSANLMRYQDSVYFIDTKFGPKTDNQGETLRRYDGKSNTVVAQLTEGGVGWFQPVVLGGSLYAIAQAPFADWRQIDDDGAHVCRGVTENLRLAPGHVPAQFFRGRYYFSAGVASGPNDLWTWDGDSTKKAVDLGTYQGCWTSCVFQNALYFSIGDHEKSELWKYDGEGVSRVALGRPYKSAHAYREVRGVLMLLLDDGEHGVEPWYFDGREAHMIADVMPGPADSDACVRAEFNGRVFGTAELPICGLELCEFVFDPMQEVAEPNGEDLQARAAERP